MKRTRIDEYARSVKRAGGRAAAAAATRVGDATHNMRAALNEIAATVPRKIAEAADTLSFTGKRVTVRNMADIIMEDIGNSITVGEAASGAAKVAGGVAALATAATVAETIGLGPPPVKRNPAAPGLIDKESMAMLVTALQKNNKRKRSAPRKAMRRYVKRKYMPVRRYYKPRYTPKRYVKRRYYRRRY